MAALAVLVAVSLPAFLAGALAPFIRRELALGHAQLAAAIGCYFGAIGVSGVPVARLVDRLGWRRAIHVAAGFCAMSLVGAASAENWWHLAIALATGGVAVAFASPSANLILIKELPRQRLGLLTGVKQAAIPLATLVAGLSLPTVAPVWGWRGTFLASLALPVFSVSWAYRVTANMMPLEIRTPVTRGHRNIPRAGIVLTTLAGGLGIVASGALNSFLVSSGVSIGISTEQAGLVLVCASVGGIAVRVAGGWLADRLGGNAFVYVAMLLAVGAAGFGMLSIGSASWWVPSALLAYWGGWGWAGLYHLGIITRSPDRAARATGLAESSMATGYALGPIAVGAVIDRHGFATGWLIVTAVTAVAAGMMWFSSAGAAKRT